MMYVDWVVRNGTGKTNALGEKAFILLWWSDEPFPVLSSRSQKPRGCVDAYISIAWKKTSAQYDVNPRESSLSATAFIFGSGVIITRLHRDCFVLNQTHSRLTRCESTPQTGGCRRRTAGNRL